ncbi:hypothetical protein E4K10_43225 [Streptomyces sp. T1317-0309]|nr:hypothetical protein E4K10_43225 [Streptomyces sp. T1317-0309]
MGCLGQRSAAQGGPAGGRGANVIGPIQPRRTTAIRDGNGNAGSTALPRDQFSSNPTVVSTADTTNVTSRPPSPQVFHKAQPSDDLGATPRHAHASPWPPPPRPG